MFQLEFDKAHDEYISFHQERRTGERLRRLVEGHGHAERLFLQNVWWPAFGNFRHLHPEYEIVDFDGSPRFLDFAYIQHDVHLALEIDGFGSHARNLDRRQFTAQLRRQNHLVLDGWKVLRFSYDEVRDQPRHCQRLLQQFMGRWADGWDAEGLTMFEKALLRLPGGATGLLTPKQAQDYLGVGKHKAARIIRSLVERGWLEPARGKQRIRAYRVSVARLFRDGR